MPRFQMLHPALLLLTIAVACGGSDASAPPAVASLIVSPPSAAVVAGSTQQLTATARGASGESLTGRPVTWTSSGIATATVDGSGLVTAIAVGSATVTVSSGGVSTPVSITVLPVPVASVVITPPIAPPSSGSVFQLTAVASDARGGALAGRTVQWSTSNAQVATITPSGLATAVAPGVVTFLASSEGQTGTITITVVGAVAPSITSVLPANVSPGVALTIQGQNFDPTPSNNTVTVRGVTVPVVSGTSTQLTINMPCVESGSTPVRVAARGVASEPLTVSNVVPQRAIPVGQALVVTNNAGSLCNEIATSSATARYVVAVFNASTSPNNLVDFDLGGATPATVAEQPALHVAASDERVASRVRSAAERLDDERDEAHWQMLERNRADYARLMAATSPSSRESASRGSASRGTATRAAAELPAVGDMRSLFFTFTGGCADTTRVVRGKAIYVGTRAIIWEDSANALQSGADEVLAGYYARLGRIFDLDQYDAVRNTFGDPLLRDGVTDNDGRVHMVFTSRVNGTSAAAYVTSCDQFPTSTTPGSNFGQFFYGFVPTAQGANLGSTATPDGWFNFMARTIVHEVKHIASLSARVANNSPTFEQSWLEEGTARHAEEVWVRESLHRVPWKGNTGFGTPASNGIYCDFIPSNAVCLANDALRRPSYGMRRQFNESLEKLEQPGNFSPYGEGTGQSGAVFYNTAWSLVRYTIDRYAASDAAFFRTLMNASTSGAVNLAATAGVSIDQLIGGWGLALYADDYPGLVNASADIQFPTWNMRSIYGALHDAPEWAARFRSTYPVKPLPLDFGPFASRVTGMRGGAHAYFEITGTPRALQLLSLRGIGGAPPSGNLRLAIARLQ